MESKTPLITTPLSDMAGIDNLPSLPIWRSNLKNIDSQVLGGMIVNLPTMSDRMFKAWVLGLLDDHNLQAFVIATNSSYADIGWLYKSPGTNATYKYMHGNGTNFFHIVLALRKGATVVTADEWNTLSSATYADNNILPASILSKAKPGQSGSETPMAQIHLINKLYLTTGGTLIGLVDPQYSNLSLGGATVSESASIPGVEHVDEEVPEMKLPPRPKGSEVFMKNTKKVVELMEMIMSASTIIYHSEMALGHLREGKIPSGYVKTLSQAKLSKIVSQLGELYQGYAVVLDAMKKADKASQIKSKPKVAA